MTPKQQPDRATQAMQAYGRNRPNVSSAQLQRYAGQYIAWDPDVTQVIAFSEKEEDLLAEVQKAHHDPQNCVVAYIPGRP